MGARSWSAAVLTAGLSLQYLVFESDRESRREQTRPEGLNPGEGVLFRAETFTNVCQVAFEAPSKERKKGESCPQSATALWGKTSFLCLKPFFQSPLWPWIYLPTFMTFLTTCTVSLWSRFSLFCGQLPTDLWPWLHPGWSTSLWACWCSRPPPWCSPCGTPALCRPRARGIWPPQLWWWPRSWRSSPVCCSSSKSTVSAHGHSQYHLNCMAANNPLFSLFCFILSKSIDFFFFKPKNRLWGL